MSGFREKPSGVPADVPHYHGHRERLKARFRDTGGEAMADYELLELLLYVAHPRIECGRARLYYRHHRFPLITRSSRWIISSRPR